MLSETQDRIQSIRTAYCCHMQQRSALVLQHCTATENSRPKQERQPSGVSAKAFIGGLAAGDLMPEGMLQVL